MKKQKGLTFIEVLMALLIIGVLTVSLTPVFTAKHDIGTRNGNQDKDASSCVLGTSSISTSTPPCSNVITTCLANDNNSCNTLFNIASYDPNTSNQANARNIIGNVCNQGGFFACKYIVDACKNDSAKCSIASDNNDLNYYMTLPLTSSNLGRPVVQNIAGQYYVGATNGSVAGMYPSIKTEIENDCASTNTSAETACNIIANNCMNNNISASCTLLATDCQNNPSTTGTNSACKIERYISPPDPSCGSAVVGSIWVSLCHNSYTPVANNASTSECWLGGESTSAGNCSGSGCGPNGAGTSETLCTYKGAVDACNALNITTSLANTSVNINYQTRNWRLPTTSELANFGTSKTVLGICDGNGGSNYCSDPFQYGESQGYSGCPNSYLNLCFPDYLWASSTSPYADYYLYNGTWSYQNEATTSNWADGVRCVRNI